MSKALTKSPEYQRALALAIKIRNTRRYPTTQCLQTAIDTYMANEDVPTLQGLQVHCKLSPNAWAEYASWDDDYGREPDSKLGTYAQCIEKAVAMLSAYLAKWLLTWSRNPAGGIFTLKNWYGWQDETRHVVDSRSVQYVITLPAQQSAKDWQDEHAASLQAPTDVAAIETTGVPKITLSGADDVEDIQGDAVELDSDDVGAPFPQADPGPPDGPPSPATLLSPTPATISPTEMKVDGISPKTERGRQILADGEKAGVVLGRVRMRRSERYGKKLQMKEARKRQTAREGEAKGLPVVEE